MTAKDLHRYQAGDSLPPLALPPLSRHVLALYCGGSGDHVAIHTDSDVARSAGLPDVIGHGMLTMAYVGRMLTNIVEQRAIRSWNVMFLSPSHVGDRITCHGRIAERREDDWKVRFLVELRATTDDGRELARGEALIVLSSLAQDLAAEVTREGYQPC